MPIQKGEEAVLTIDRLVYGGEGIGSVEGFKVFVPNVAPGDKVRVVITRRRSHFAEGRVIEMIKPSAQRIEPRRMHFSECGGCQWQFLSYEDQVKIKEDHVRDALSRIGGLSPDLVQPILPNESPWFYRNKMEVSFGPGPDELVQIGLYPPGFHYEVFDLKECFLESKEMPEFVAKVREFAHKHKIPFYNGRSETGFLRSLILREGKNTGERMLILHTAHQGFPQLEAFTKLFKDDPRVTSLYWITVEQLRGKPTKFFDHHLAGKPVLTESMTLEGGAELHFDILPRAFFQTNTKQAERLYAKAVEVAGLTGEETVFDLYCGTGTIGLFCAHKAKHVVGIDMNESAIENAQENTKRNGITNAEFICGSVESQLKNLTHKPDVVVVDPPRAGLGEEVVAQCAAFKADRIVYVSCNPTSLARDLKWFAEQGYETQSVSPIDMFPQTHHVECVALLKRS